MVRLRTHRAGEEIVVVSYRIVPVSYHVRRISQSVNLNQSNDKKIYWSLFLNLVKNHLGERKVRVALRCVALPSLLNFKFVRRTEWVSSVVRTYPTYKEYLF